jgi:hypothetical protein
VTYDPRGGGLRERERRRYGERDRERERSLKLSVHDEKMLKQMRIEVGPCWSFPRLLDEKSGNGVCLRRQRSWEWTLKFGLWRRRFF